MKMHLEDFKALRAAIAARFTWADYSAIRARYQDRGLSAERFRWDMLQASGFNSAGLYNAGLNDAHIDTALRKIFYTLN